MPVFLNFGQFGFHRLWIGIFADHGLRFGILPGNSHKKNVIFGFTGFQNSGSKPDTAHRFLAGGFRAGGHGLHIAEDRAGTEEASAFSNETVNRRIEADRCFAVFCCTGNEICQMIPPVALFVKGHSGLHQHGIVGGADAVEHGGDIPVIPDVVGASAIDRNGGNGIDAAAGI